MMKCLRNLVLLILPLTMGHKIVLLKALFSLDFHFRPRKEYSKATSSGMKRPRIFRITSWPLFPPRLTQKAIWESKITEYYIKTKNSNLRKIGMWKAFLGSISNTLQYIEVENVLTSLSCKLDYDIKKILFLLHSIN